MNMGHAYDDFQLQTNNVFGDFPARKIVFKKLKTNELIFSNVKKELKVDL